LKGEGIMKFHIETIIKTLQKERNKYSEQSDTYKVLGNVIDMLETDLKMEEKLVREV
jgi:hypothetical protein